MEKILLGFSVPDGEPVYLPLHHLAIFGMTQLSGKTTTLEALISRSGLKAIAFITKRGEAGFTKYREIPPYYKSRADWQFVEGLVNVALGEKVKYEPGMRWAIIKVSKGAKNLREVKEKAEEMLEKAKRDFQKQLFEKLITYLEIVVPELERWQFSDKLELSEGINIMDLSAMRTETQHLVIASTIDYAFQNLDHVVVIIPEAWETLPQNKMTPVKWVAQQFIRKGAAIGNYMFLDSQDIGGLDKTPLRQCDNWLMGRMKEAHEVERILKQLLGMKVKAEEIQTLPLGHFYAVVGNEVKKVYVLPAGVPEEVGVEVAKGIKTPEFVRDQYLKPKLLGVNEIMWKERFEEERRKREELEREFTRQVERLSDLKAEQKIKEAMQKLEEYQKTIKQLKDENATLKQQATSLEAELNDLRKVKDALSVLIQGELKRLDWEPYRKALESTSATPSEVTVSLEQPTLTVKIERKPLIVSQNDLLGRIAIVYVEGLLPTDRAFTLRQLNQIMEQRFGRKEAYANFSKPLTDLVAWGFLEKVHAGKRWDYRVKMKPEEAKAKGLLIEVEQK